MHGGQLLLYKYTIVKQLYSFLISIGMHALRMKLMKIIIDRYWRPGKREPFFWVYALVRSSCCRGGAFCRMYKIRELSIYKTPMKLKCRTKSQWYKHISVSKIKATFFSFVTNCQKCIVEKWIKSHPSTVACSLLIVA